MPGQSEEHQAIEAARAKAILEIGYGKQMNSDLVRNDSKLSGERSFNPAKFMGSLKKISGSQVGLHVDLPKKCEVRDCLLHHEHAKLQKYSQTKFIRK
jgi:hypothetical protein